MSDVTVQGKRRIPKCAPRRSGLTNLQLALLGKGVAARFRRPMSRYESDAWIRRHQKPDAL